MSAQQEQWIELIEAIGWWSLTYVLMMWWV